MIKLIIIKVAAEAVIKIIIIKIIIIEAESALIKNDFRRLITIRSFLELRSLRIKLLKLLALF